MSLLLVRNCNECVRTTFSILLEVRRITALQEEDPVILLSRLASGLGAAALLSFTLALVGHQVRQLRRLFFSTRAHVRCVDLHIQRMLLQIAQVSPLRLTVELIVRGTQAIGVARFRDLLQHLARSALAGRAQGR